MCRVQVVSLRCLYSLGVLFRRLFSLDVFFVFPSVLLPLTTLDFLVFWLAFWRYAVNSCRRVKIKASIYTPSCAASNRVHCCRLCSAAKNSSICVLLAAVL